MSKPALAMFSLIIVVAGGILVSLHFRSLPDVHQRRLMQNSAAGSPDFSALKAIASRMVVQLPAPTDRDKRLAVLGRGLFFDVRLSKNGKVAYLPANL